METAKPRAKAAPSVGRKPRFQSELTEHLNAILRLRYAERKPVAEVLAWLSQQKCVISPRNYHGFMDRVLRLMSLEQAKSLAVDVELLRAVRVRLKYTVDPRRPTALGSKRVKRFFSRSRQRRLRTVPKAKRPSSVPVVVKPVRRERSGDDNQLPLAGIVAAAGKPGLDQLTGDVNNPDTLTRADWKIINEMAHSKLRAIDRKVYPNQQGRVLHLTTRMEYTRADLEKQYGLTATEAESCFLTL